MRGAAPPPGLVRGGKVRYTGRMLGPSLRIVTVAGIPIRVHWTLILIVPLLQWNLDLNAPAALGIAVGLFASIVLHELGHSLVAIRSGCRVREILLLPIGGAARMESMPRRPLHEFLMALAGPLVSLALAAGCWYGWTQLRGSTLVQHRAGLWLCAVLQLLCYLNLGLGVFNLLPAFPMDGGRVLRALLTPRLGYLRATHIAARIGRTLAFGGIVFGLWDLFHAREYISLLFISLFIYWAAGAEYRVVRLQELRRQAGGTAWFWPPPPMPEAAGDQATVTPPPYRKGRPEQVPVRSVDPHQGGPGAWDA